MTSGKTKICGIMACPVEHSMSPLMHNFYAEETGIDLHYVPFMVLPEQLEAAVQGAYALHIQGLNVTVPHKQEVMAHLVALDDDARAIGAVNTLVRVEGGFKGYNTDAAGLLRAMTEEGVQIQGQTCILLGAGGAAKAAAYVLARQGASRVYVLNRNQERAQNLALYMNRLIGREVLIPMELDAWNRIPEDSCLAVQTTSVGMHPKVEEVIIDHPDFYRKIHTAVDAVYIPATTCFMKLAAEAGARTMNGLNMLLYQGIIAYELWNPGITVGSDTAAAARGLLLDALGGHR